MQDLLVVGELTDRAALCALGPRFRLVADFIAKTDLSALPLGRQVIEDGAVWANVDAATLVPASERRTEWHVRYADIQIPLVAPETIGIAELEPEARATGFDAARDIGFCDRTPMRSVTLRPGQFAVIFPPLGHAPACIADAAAPTAVRKVVVKVRVE